MRKSTSTKQPGRQRGIESSPALSDYRLIADSAFNWETLLTPEGRFLYCSPACQRITGYAPEEFLADPDLLTRIIHPEDHARWLAHTHHDVRKEIEFRVTHRDGTERWIAHVCHQLRNAQGHPLGHRGSNRDITERKRTEKQAAASERRYQALFDVALDAVFIMDPEGRFLEANPAAERLSGYTAAELRQMTFVELCEPEERERAVAAFQRALRGTPSNLATAITARDGRRVELFLTGFLLIVDGQTIGLFAIAKDITEQEQAEQVIYESEVKFRAVFEQAAVGIVRSDLQGNIIESNLAFQTLVGRTREELAQISVLDLTHPDDWKMEQDQVRQMLASGTDSCRLEKRYVRSDGTIAWADLMISPVRDVTGRPVFVIGIVQDITERKRAEEGLRRRQQWDEAFKTIGRAATSGAPLEEILASGLEALINVSGASMSLLRLVDPTSKDLVIAAHRGVPKDYLDMAGRIPWGAGVAGAVVASGTPRIMNRPQEDPELSCVSLRNRSIQSVTCIPLNVRGRIIGSLTLAHPQPDFFNPAELPFLLGAAALLTGAIFAEQLRTAAKEEAEEKALLFRELDHRIRNNLAALISLLHLSEEKTEGSASETLREMAGRVERLADVHNLLTERGSQPVDVRELAELVGRNVLEALPDAVKIRWTVTGQSALLPPSRVTALALVLNELFTNCAKHAFLGRETGAVTILVGREGNEVELIVRDDGVGFDRERGPAGLGLSIVQALVTQNLRGSVAFVRPGDGGAAVHIRFPQQEGSPAGGAI